MKTAQQKFANEIDALVDRYRGKIGPGNMVGALHSKATLIVVEAHQAWMYETPNLPMFPLKKGTVINRKKRKKKA